jgi:hypothetical protein
MVAEVEIGYYGVGMNEGVRIDISSSKVFRDSKWERDN